jgi:hypothetical protein
LLLTCKCDKEVIEEHVSLSLTYRCKYITADCLENLTGNCDVIFKLFAAK